MARRRDIDRLTELEELFADLWQVPRFAAGTRLVHRPQIDVVRTDDPPELTVVVEIPGADVDSIGVVVDGRRLVVTGERPRPRAGDQVWYRSEIEYGPFEREVSLAVDVDAGRACAASSSRSRCRPTRTWSGASSRSRTSSMRRARSKP